jgi:hypothetical protein
VADNSLRLVVVGEDNNHLVVAVVEEEDNVHLEGNSGDPVKEEEDRIAVEVLVKDMTCLNKKKREKPEKCC